MNGGVDTKSFRSPLVFPWPSPPLKSHDPCQCLQIILYLRDPPSPFPFNKIKISPARDDKEMNYLAKPHLGQFVTPQYPHGHTVLWCQIP